MPITTAILMPPPSERNIDRMAQWLPPVVDAITEHGSVWLFAEDAEAAETKMLATQHAKLFCRSWIVWMRGECNEYWPAPFHNTHSHVFFFTKHKKNHTFNADAIRVPSARQLVYRDKRANAKGRLPDDTWIIGRTADGLPPALFLERIVLCSTSPGDTILEPWPIGTVPVGQKHGRFVVQCHKGDLS